MPQTPSLHAGDGHPGNGRAHQNGQQSLYDAPYDEPPNGAERIRALLTTLWGGKWIILSVFVLVVGAVAAYTYTRTPQYQTSTLLLVDLGQGQSAVPSLTGGVGGSSMYGAQQRSLSNQILVLNQSDALAREVAYRLDTMATNPRTGKRLNILTTPTGEYRSRAAIAGVLRGSVQARSAGQRVDAIQISATSPVPSEASIIADQFASAYLDWSREKSRESLQAKRQFLEEQTQKFETRVEEADAQLASYMQEEDAVSLDQESSQLVQQLSQLEARHDELRIELDMAESALNTKRSELERIRPRLAERISSGIHTELKQVQQEKANVSAEINRVKTRNPNLTANGTSARARDLARLQERAQRLERQADSLASAYVDRTLAAGGIGASSGGEGEGSRGISYVVQLQRQIAQQEIRVNGLQAQITTVERQINENRSRLQNLPPKSLQLADLQREKQSMEQIHNFVRQQLQETRMAEESEIGFAERIRSAGIPMRPVSPNSQRNLMLAAILSLLLGGGLVVLRERLDTRVRSPEDLEALGQNVIGVVPAMGSMIDIEFNGRQWVKLDERTVPSALVMLTSPMSAAAESFRRLRSNLRFARPDDRLRSIAVTSAHKGEGKSTVATNLAMAMASADQDVLLVDADLRRPKLHEFLDLPQSPGLSEALYDETTVQTVGSLSVLTAGEEIPNPAEVLSSRRMQQFLAEMEASYDQVIVDTPPGLLFSDAGGLAPYADGTMLVSYAGRTDAHSVEHLALSLRDVDANVIGTVLNHFRPDAQRHGYAYGYGYGYSYGYGYAYSKQYDDQSLEAYYEDDADGDGSVASTVRSWWNGGR